VSGERLVGAVAAPLCACANDFFVAADIRDPFGKYAIMTTFQFVASRIVLFVAATVVLALLYRLGRVLVGDWANAKTWSEKLTWMAVMFGLVIAVLATLLYFVLVVRPDV